LEKRNPLKGFPNGPEEEAADPNAPDVNGGTEVPKVVDGAVVAVVNEENPAGVEEGMLGVACNELA